MSTFDIASILFLVAALAGLANERLFGLPRGIALLIASLVLSLLMAALGHVAPVSWLASASKHRLLRADLPRVLLDGVLALLLFAATWHVDLAGLRRQAGLITIFATLGVLLASAAFAFGFWLTTLAFGASIPWLVLSAWNYFGADGCRRASTACSSASRCRRAARHHRGREPVQ